jgi:predicted signal transduction protein with EAL and GGDEF domain
MRPRDGLFRLGGDEFALLLAVAERGEAALIAERLIAQLSAPYVIGQVTVRIGVCIGIAMLDEYRCNAAAVHHEADLALYAAKAAGRGTVRFAATTANGRVAGPNSVAADLLALLDDRDIFVEYQPIIDLQSGQTRSFEALVRWQHPTRGVLYPDEFIAAAEETGVISRIGWIVIERALAELCRWPDSVSIAINLSPVQLHDISLCDKIEMLIAESKIHPGRVYFEITEKLQIERRHAVDSFFARMQLFGCRLSLDDFGSGYSSIKSLFEFRFDKIKIDRSLFSAAMADSRRLEVLIGVRDLARRIGVTLTVEGIETEQEAVFLRDAAFQEGQGYYFGRPMPAAQLLPADDGAAMRREAPVAPAP